MFFRIIFLLGLAFLWCDVSLVFSSPWGREKGEVFISPQFFYYRATHYWDKSGERKAMDCTFEKLENTLYSEWGFSSSTTVVSKVSYQSLSCGGRNTSGVADLELGLMRKLRKTDRSVWSIQLLSIIPTGYSIKKKLRLGYNRPGLEIYLLRGQSFDNGFLEFGLGYRFYKGYPSDQIRSYFKFGHYFNDRLMFLGNFELHYGVNNGKKLNIGENITLEPYYRLIQADFSLSFEVQKNIMLNLGVIKAIWGRNTGDGVNFYGQIWFFF